MAEGDFTITSSTRNVVGNVQHISGTIEAGTSAATAKIFPKSHIITFNILHNVDGVATAVPRVHINASDFAGTTEKGSVHIDTNVAGPETFNWTATYV